MYFNPHSYLQVSHININNYIFCSGSFAVLRNISLMLYCLQSYSLQLHEQEFIVIKIVYCFFSLLVSGGTCTDQKVLVFQLGCSGVGRVREIIVFASMRTYYPITTDTLPQSAHDDVAIYNSKASE